MICFLNIFHKKFRKYPKKNLWNWYISFPRVFWFFPWNQCNFTKFLKFREINTHLKLWLMWLYMIGPWLSDLIQCILQQDSFHQTLNLGLHLQLRHHRRLQHSGLKLKKWCNKELLHKCERGNKIAPLWHKCWVKRGMCKCTEGVKFYCPTSTYPAIVLLVLYFIA